jgi:serine/threonine-protein kinase
LIEREIGAGGMATVYLAQDLKHARPVALKVLRPELGAVLGVDRFLTEIKVTANLQHPNLLPLFDSGEADGFLFYVMPFVDGESLRARLDREKQLPVDEAVRLAVAVAGAVDYAHRHNVVHRDLKPENILLQDGQPVVADFGIALAVVNAGGARVTQTGLSLGTPQYMSPEQATGDRAIDGRTDVYSLGAVTYEMLAGEAPHTGTNAQAIIAKLMTEEPRPLTVLRRSVPDAVDAAVRQALEKLPADRFATAHEFADVLLGKALARPRIAPRASRSAQRWKLATAAVSALALLFAAASITQWRVAAEPGATVRLSLVADEGSALQQQGTGVRFAVSNDGTRLAYVGGDSVTRLYVRRLDDVVSTPLVGTESAIDPQFSPDGKWIGFVAGDVPGDVLKKVPVAGGAPITIAGGARRFTWGDGDVIVLRTRRGLWRVSAVGGTPTQVTRTDTVASAGHYWPHLLPGGKTVLFTLGVPGDSSEVAATRLDDGKVVRLGVYGINPRYLATGHISFAHANGTVFVAPFDALELSVTGPAVPVLEDVLTRNGGAAQYAVSRTGVLVYLSARQTSQLVETDRNGRERLRIAGAAGYGYPRYSPDGRRVALSMGQPTSSAFVPIGDPDIWVVDLATRAATRLSTDGRSTYPAWTADGLRVVWQTRSAADVPAIAWRSANAGTPVETLLDSAVLADVSPTGRYALTVRWPATGSVRNLTRVVLDSTRQRSEVPFEGALSTVRSARISMDGRWLVWSTGGAAATRDNQDGAVVVQDLTGRDGQSAIVADKGRDPAWSADAKDVFFRVGDKMVRASLARAPKVGAERFDTLFDFPSIRSQSVFRASDVSPDGQRFVIVKPLTVERPPVVVVNWFTELRQRMVTGKNE